MICKCGAAVKAARTSPESPFGRSALGPEGRFARGFGRTLKANGNVRPDLQEIGTIEAGSKLEHICKITIYIVDPRYRETVYRVVGKWLKGVYPVSTGVVVSALGRPEWLVEVDATAVIPEAKQ